MRHRLARAVALEVEHRLVALPDADLAALGLIALDEMRPTPTFVNGRELPAEIDEIPEAGIHAKPAVRRHHVHCVACEHDPATAVVIGHKMPPDPVPELHDLEWRIIT